MVNVLFVVTNWFLLWSSKSNRSYVMVFGVLKVVTRPDMIKQWLKVYKKSFKEVYFKYKVDKY